MCSDPEDPTPTCDGSGTPPPSTNPGGNGGGGGGGDEEESNPGLCAIYGEGCGGGKALAMPFNPYGESDRGLCSKDWAECIYAGSMDLNELTLAYKMYTGYEVSQTYPIARFFQDASTQVANNEFGHALIAYTRSNDGTYNLRYANGNLIPTDISSLIGLMTLENTLRAAQENLMLYYDR